jgi:hypothetical protein
MFQITDDLINKTLSKILKEKLMQKLKNVQMVKEVFI